MKNGEKVNCSEAVAGSVRNGRRKFNSSSGTMIKNGIPVTGKISEKFDAIQEVPAAYVSIFEEVGKNSIFLTSTWFNNFIENLIVNEEAVQMYGVRDACNKPIAALLIKKVLDRGNFLSPKKFKSLSNYYTSLFDLIMDPDESEIEETLDVMVRSIEEDRNDWDILELRPLDCSSSLFEGLVNTFQRSGFLVQPFFDFGNWYLDIGGRSYAEYFNDLPKVLRKNIPYLKRRLGKIGKVRIEVFTDEASVDLHIQEYHQVYCDSWREPEPYPEFINQLAKVAAREKWLRLGILYLDDEPVAAQIWFVHNSIASIFKICYVEKLSKLSVGTVLTSHMLEQVIDDEKVVQVDYLSGDDAYKKNWMNRRRERKGILVFNPKSIRGALAAFRHIGGRGIRRLWTVSLEKIYSLRALAESH